MTSGHDSSPIPNSATVAAMEEARKISRRELPAFPHANPRYDGNWNKESQIAGMSLRDYFAGQALIGMAASYGEHDMAIRAYRIADAMMVSREK